MNLIQNANICIDIDYSTCRASESRMVPAEGIVSRRYGGAHHPQLVEPSVALAADH